MVKDSCDQGGMFSSADRSKHSLLNEKAFVLIFAAFAQHVSCKVNQVS